MLSKCCCCVPLRTGSIVLAILGIPVGISTFATSGGFWLYIIQGVLYLLAYGALLFGALKYNYKAVLVNLVVTAFLIILGIIGAIIFIQDSLSSGSRISYDFYDMYASIKPFVPANKLANNCAAMAEELSKAGITCDEFKAETIGTAAGILIVSSLLNGYFWVCNYSFYKELKRGSANPA